MGGSYLRRLRAIEAVLPGAPASPWHRVIVEIGQTEVEATAAYAVARGIEVADMENIIYRIIVEPMHV